MIDAIVFDKFATLTNGLADPESRMIELFDLDLDRDSIVDVVCGTKFKDFSSYFSTVLGGLGLDYNKKNIENLIDIFIEDVSREHLEPEMLELVQHLKDNGYKLGVLSNIPNPFYDLLDSDGKLDLFNAKVYSYEEGMTKRDDRMFYTMLKKLDVVPSKVLMIGDSLKSDIELARRLGMQTIHFQGYVSLIEELIKLGVY